jgi:hypothetical protein
VGSLPLDVPLPAFLSSDVDFLFLLSESTAVGSRPGHRPLKRIWDSLYLRELKVIGATIEVLAFVSHYLAVVVRSYQARGR